MPKVRYPDSLEPQFPPYENAVELPPFEPYMPASPLPEEQPQDKPEDPNGLEISS